MLFWVWTQVGISKHALDRGCMLALPGKYEWTIHVWRQCSLISTYFDHLLLQLSISTSKQQINVNECLTDTQGKQNNWPDSNEVSAMDGMTVVLNDHHTTAQQHVCLPASILLCCQTSHQMSTGFYVITDIIQELIRRWDSERELFYNIAHVEASDYAHWTSS